ncbi:MAG: hypothetical protein IKL87_04135 [Oscillospiraceae bacterium]|nr:hypothetical protein [Oscillospiraceae bacterium]
MKLEKAVLKRFMGNRSILGWYHWAKAQKHILFGKHNLSFGDRLWCWRYGFHTGDLNLYGRENLKKNYKDYLSARDYYRLHPLNGEYSFWIDDKMTMKYILSKYNEYLPEYYFQLDKNSILKLVDCPKEKNADYESIVALLREKRILACKRLFGACGIGFYRLEFDGTDYMITGKKVSEDELIQFLKGLYSYLILEYIVNHKDIRNIWKDATNTMRVLIANCNGELVVMRSFIRFGNKKSNGVDNAHAGGIEAIIDEDTGKILFTQAQDVTGAATRITHHPDSGVSFDIQIPRWNTIIETLKKICLTYPQLRYWGFDVAVTDESFKIIEINSLSGLMAAQSKEPLLKDPKTRKVYEFFGLKMKE